MIDVKIYPKSWSLLATAIIKRYLADKKKGLEDAYMNPDWYNNLLLLANRYSELKVKELEE